MDVDSCVSPLKSAPQTRLPRHAVGTDRTTTMIIQVIIINI